MKSFAKKRNINVRVWGSESQSEMILLTFYFTLTELINYGTLSYTNNI